MTRRVADAVGIHRIPAPQRGGRQIDPQRRAGQRDLAVALEPVFVVCRLDLAHAPPQRIVYAGEAFEGGIDLAKDVVDCPSTFEQHLDHAEAGFKRAEELLVVPVR